MSAAVDVEQRSEEWFALRRRGITATDLPKILGLSTHGNARSVWHDKRGELPRDEGGEAAIWGTLLESIVGHEWARRRGVEISPAAPRVDDWMIASPDFDVATCPDGHLPGCMPGCLLEVKTRSAYVAGRWREEIPDDVLAQVAWQRLVTAAPHVHVAVLIGGQRLIEHRYDPDERLESYLVDAAGEVWLDVEEGTPPAVDYDRLLGQVLDMVMIDRTGETEVDPDIARPLVDLYEAAAAAERAARAAKDAAKARVLEALGGGEILTSLGQRHFSYREQVRRTVSLDDLRRADPELYDRLAAGEHIHTTTSRVLRQIKGGTS